VVASRAGRRAPRQGPPIGGIGLYHSGSKAGSCRGSYRPVAHFRRLRYCPAEETDAWEPLGHHPCSPRVHELYAHRLDRPDLGDEGRNGVVIRAHRGFGGNGPRSRLRPGTTSVNRLRQCATRREKRNRSLSANRSQECRTRIQTGQETFSVYTKTTGTTGGSSILAPSQWPTVSRLVGLKGTFRSVPGHVFSVQILRIAVNTL